jgi:hypothetical protein
MKYLKWVMLTTLFLSLFSCGEFTLKKSPTNYSGWKMYVTDEYSVQYPKSWRLDTSGHKGSDFTIFSAQTSLLDKFIENVSLQVYNLDSTVTDLATYVKVAEERIKSVAIDSSIFETVSIELNGIACQKVIYTTRETIYRVKLEQYIIVKNAKAYVLTLASKEGEFKNYQKRGEKMMNSFKLN